MAVSAETTTMPVALDVLFTQISQGHEIDKRGASEAIEPLLERNVQLGLASEVAWGLWAANQMEVRLNSEAAQAVSQMTDDVVALIALDTDEKDL
jgi:hypothetical protein